MNNEQEKPTPLSEQAGAQDGAWEDMPDYAALWLRFCTRIGYEPFTTYLLHEHPGVVAPADMQDRAAQLHEAVLVKGMEAIEREQHDER